MSLLVTRRPAEAGSRRSSLRLITREPGLLALVGLTAVIDAVAEIMRHVHLQSGIDIAIFDQAVWHYSRFEAPFSSIQYENLLGDHFHPLLALLAPLYWIWSDPRTLLIAQAVLVAASIVPVFLFARSRLGRAGAYLLAGAYAAFWGIQTGVLFEFHEVAFAPLLIALAVLLSDRALRAPSPRRWGHFWLVIVLLLGVKEDLSMFVVFFGIYLLTLRRMRHGVALVLVGIVWYELATRVFIPGFAGGGRGFVYWSYGELGTNPLDAILALVRAPWRLFTIGFSPPEKAHTILDLLVPFLFLSLGSRLFILALPLLAERFLSTKTSFWGTSYHYSLAIAPVLAMGAAAGLANVTRRLSLGRRRPIVLAGAGAMLVASLAISITAISGSTLHQLTRSTFYRARPDAEVAYRALGHVPSSASLGAVENLLPHASERKHIEQIDADTAGAYEYLLVNVLHTDCCGTAGNGSYDVLGKVLDKELPSMTPVYYDAGWLVARRAQRGHPATNGVIAAMGRASARQIDELWVRWYQQLAVTNTRLLTCVGRWAKRDPRATACFAGATSPIDAAQVVLARAIHAVLPSLEHDCAQLATAALVDTHRLTLDLRRLGTASASPDRRALPAAFSAATVDQQDEDLTGQLDRFVILCTPRNTTTPRS